MSVEKITVVPHQIAGYPEAYLRTHVLKYDGFQIAVIQQAVAHCCGVTFMGQLRRDLLEKPEVVKAVVDFYRRQRVLCTYVGGSLFYVKNLNFYLSEETEYWDKELKKVAKKVHSFKNGRNTVDQWVITIWDDAVDKEDEGDES